VQGKAEVLEVRRRGARDVGADIVARAPYAFVVDRLTERREVADVRTSVVYEHIRRPVLEPLGRDSRT
jgi:hypothetical protein